ncbi:aldo/keto reductase [Malaciobacter mytili]|uniref:aldo/keto reductase family protein n=1 Tax=Malaciobacter mytili TaxID=603050 RepID=UPI003BAEA3C3
MMIYGTAWKKEQTTRLVQEAVLCGFRAIDTACQPKHYREDLVGAALENLYKEGIKRNELFIQTKFTPIQGQDINNMPYLKEDNVITQLEKSFKKSKENLKTDFIDSYILHSPIYPISDLVSVYTKMQEFYENNEVGQLGISNCYDLNLLMYLYDIAKIKPKVLQNRFYAQTNYDKQLREFCKQKGITYQSFWSLSANAHILASNELEDLSFKYNKSVAQIFYRFLTQINITPLNGTTSKVHMLEDLQIQEFTLKEDEVNLILKFL